MSQPRQPQSPIDAIKASVCRDSLKYFIEQAWPYFEPSKPLVWSWHLDVLCDKLEAVTRGEIKRLIINIPPGTSKSAIVSVFWPCFEWASDPSMRYLTASYTDTNTIRDNRRARDIVTSDWYRNLIWSDVPKFNQVQLSSDQAAKLRFDTTAKGWRIATSVGGMGTGEHPNRIIIDDPLKADDRFSDVKLKACNEWYDNTISSRIRLSPAIIVIMQRLHMNDLSGHLLEKGGWEHLCLPMYYESYNVETKSGIWDCDCHKQPDPDDIREVDGELLCPALIPAEDVTLMEADMGFFAASGQLQQRPVPISGGLVERDWFEIVEQAPSDAVRCRGWDIGETQDGGDPTATVKMAYVRSTGVLYIEHAAKDQLSPGKVDRWISRTALSDGKSTKIREGSGSGKSVIAARGVELAGFDYAESKEVKDKVTRFNPFRAQSELRNVKLVRGEWNSQYLDEICAFPLGRYDDYADASSNAANELLTSKKYNRATW